MPKVFLLSEEKQLERIRAAIYGKMKINRITTTDLAAVWEISQPGAAYRIREGKVSVIDLWKAQQILGFTDEELIQIVRGDRPPASGMIEALPLKRKRNGARPIFHNQSCTETR